MPEPTPCQRPDANPDDWFAPVGTRRERSARARCLNECPIFHACRQEALEIGIPYGTWGGLDERTRERIWARTPGGRPTIFDENLARLRELADEAIMPPADDEEAA